MARYLYACNKCNKQFEVEKIMADAAREESCPDCHQTGLRVFTVPARLANNVCDATETESCTGCQNTCCYNH